MKKKFVFEFLNKFSLHSIKKSSIQILLKKCIKCNYFGKIKKNYINLEATLKLGFR